MTDKHQRSSEEMITVARRLIRESAASWGSLTGRLEVRENEAWLNEGRKRFHGLAALERSAVPDIRAVGYSFAVIRSPWRMRMQLTHSAAPGDQESYPDLIIHRDLTWWARTGSEVITNSTNVSHSVGLFGLEFMICPQSLADTLYYLEAREIVRERPSILVEAGASEMAWRHAPELVVLSVSRYELEVDMELGILLANRAYIDDTIARNITLHDIRVDQALDDETVFGMPM